MGHNSQHQIQKTSPHQHQNQLLPSFVPKLPYPKNKNAKDGI